jgi:hypothetical protein
MVSINIKFHDNQFLVIQGRAQVWELIQKLQHLYVKFAKRGRSWISIQIGGL